MAGARWPSAGRPALGKLTGLGEAFSIAKIFLHSRFLLWSPSTSGFNLEPPSCIHVKQMYEADSHLTQSANVRGESGVSQAW